MSRGASPASEHGIFVDHNLRVCRRQRDGAADRTDPLSASINGADGDSVTKDGKFVMMTADRQRRAPATLGTARRRRRCSSCRPIYDRSDRNRLWRGRRLRQSPRRHRRCGDQVIGHFGAPSNNPVDDTAAAAAGPWMKFHQGQHEAGFFATPLREISRKG
jgi:hypothetical protein